MSDVGLVLLALVAAASALAGAITGLVILGIAIDDRIRRRRRDRRGMTDREVASSLDPGEYGVDISVWPSRAPRNGSSYEDVA